MKLKKYSSVYQFLVKSHPATSRLKKKLDCAKAQSKIKKKKKKKKKKNKKKEKNNS